MNMRIFQELSSKHQFGLYTKELTHQVAQKNIIYIYIIYMQQTQLMAMITWAKKKFKQIYQYRAKGPMVLRLKYPPIWADWAEHANCYLLKECYFLIFLQSPMQPQYVPLALYWQICLNFFFAQVTIAMICDLWSLVYVVFVVWFLNYIPTTG